MLQKSLEKLLESRLTTTPLRFIMLVTTKRN